MESTQNQIKRILAKHNLDEKESEVYFALLAIGESGLVPVAKKVGIPRNTAAYSLEKLKGLGLIDIIQRSSRRIYIPRSPKALLELAKKQKRETEQEIRIIEEKLPDLNQIYKTPDRPQVRYFRGRDELRKIYEEMIEEPVDEIVYVGEYLEIVKAIGSRWLQQLLVRRIAKKIHTSSIRVRSKEVDVPIFQSPKETNRTIRYAPEDFKSPGHITIYGDNVAIITTSKENFGVVITSRDYAIIMRNWYKQLWKVSSE